MSWICNYEHDDDDDSTTTTMMFRIAWALERSLVVERRRRWRLCLLFALLAA